MKNRLKKLILLLLFGNVGWLCAQEAADSTKNSGAIVHADSSEAYLPVRYFDMSVSFPYASFTHELDTGINGLQNRESLRASRNIYSTFSVIGQAHQSLNFTLSPALSFSAKSMPYPCYLRTTENWERIAVDKVYTMLRYEWGNGQENSFDVEHAQRIGNFTYNVGLQTRLSEGIYVNEGLRDINIGFQGHRFSDTLRYGYDIFLIYNLFHLKENGGITYNSEYESDMKERAMEVNTPYAQNRFHQQHYGYRHWIRLGNHKDSTGHFPPSRGGYLLHQIDWKQHHTVYTDEQPNPSLFPNCFFDSGYTHDSSGCRQLRNQLFWTNRTPSEPNDSLWKAAFGLSHEYAHCFDTLSHYRTQVWSAKGLIGIPLGKAGYWSGQASYAFSGYNTNDWDIRGEYVLPLYHGRNTSTDASGHPSGHPQPTGRQQRHDNIEPSDTANDSKQPSPVGSFTAKIRYAGYEADYFFTHYQSNYAAWDNDLKKQRMLQASAGLELFRCQLNLHSFLLDNHVLLTATGVEQLAERAFILQGEIFYPLRWKGFGADIQTFAQHSNNDNIHLPTLVTRDALFYGFPLFHDALYLQFGAELTWFSAYYANGYRPDMQQFYSQSDELVGNDFYINAFVNARIQHFQVYAAAANLLTAFDGFYPYQLPHYPAKGFGFRMGVSWRFYD